MPVQLFTAAERARRNRFPETIAHEDLVAFLTLSERDLNSIPRSSAPHNLLGYALQLCALRWMGFVPDDLTTAPPAPVAFRAQQLGVDPEVLSAYGAQAVRPIFPDCMRPTIIQARVLRCRRSTQF
jgi:Domain of unknown function (DUF4158)